MKLVRKSALIGSLVMLNAGLFALTGTEIARNAHDIADPRTTHAAVKMDLVSENGDVDSRMVEEWSTEDGELESTVMVFRSPRYGKGYPLPPEGERRPGR